MASVYSHLYPKVPVGTIRKRVYSVRLTEPAPVVGVLGMGEVRMTGKTDEFRHAATEKASLPTFVE